MDDVRGSFLFHVVVLLALSASMVCNVQAQEKKTFKEKLVHFLDSSNVSGTDPQYIELPTKRWRLMVNSGFDQLDLKMNSHQEYSYYEEGPEENYDVKYDMTLRVKPPVTKSIGLWAGYLGWGFGYSVSLSGNKGINMSFNIATPSNGVNIRVRRFDYSKLWASLNNHSVNNVPDEDTEGDFDLSEPMKIESFDFDGYWIFNQKRYALAAAYGQSVIQKRSAGSLIAGAMFHYQKFDFSQRDNYIDISSFIHGLGKIKVYQAAIGLGYTYNWVPAKGLLINGVVMPVIGLWNHMNVAFYKHDPSILIDADENGLIDRTNEEDWRRFVIPYEDRTESDNGPVNFNLDTRISISYSYRNWMFNIMGQGHRFSTESGTTSIRTIDWDIKLSAGFWFDNPFKKKKKTNTTIDNY
jgi:hypothetical protein